MTQFIVVKDDKPSVVYRYTRKEPGQVVPGVAARDLTEFDLASYSPEQRLAIHLEAQRDGGAYALKGTVPKGLSFEPDAPPAADDPDDGEAVDVGQQADNAEPAASARRRK